MSVAFWDHWVPSGNAAMQKQVEAGAAKNQLVVQADFNTAPSQKNIMTIAAEAQARSGHDIQTFPTWEMHNDAEWLEPVDDVMKRLTHKYGQVNEVCGYLAKVKRHRLAVQTSSGTQYKGPCGRISVLNEKAGLDVVGTYPAEPGHTPASDGRTWDAHYQAAETCAKAAMPFAIGLGQTTDSVDTAGVNEVIGYDVPPFNSMLDFKVWEAVEPPKGPIYNDPMRPFHDANPHIAALPAPPEIAVQIHDRGTTPTMLAKLKTGEQIDKVIAWANDELEGFAR